MQASAVLHNAQQAQEALQALYRQVKPWLMADHKFVVTVKPKKRSLEQNAKFHAMCEDIEKSGVTWAGKTRTAEEWKVLLVSGHAVATKESAEIIPGLEGEFVNIRESTALMSVKRSASLIEYTAAFCVANGVNQSASN